MTTLKCPKCGETDSLYLDETMHVRTGIVPNEADEDGWVYKVGLYTEEVEEEAFYCKKCDTSFNYKKEDTNDRTND